ncbi:subunit 17 of mediator complex-domain-containing protein [Cantharellus anzutake]|uniref:subunit 17 of mediator complex-domain-containing protein n=1 Tax=Cantharellus anzutake TaxID=1750568 RepID=UPI001905D2B7|nr:subunit 17 of mediator complex-domain-containing protein [Cantharellus anzutake]KAF8341421.1 subunit 17 of mediator complex-domain-containing protein [Cantharellus anzutake]
MYPEDEKPSSKALNEQIVIGTKDRSLKDASDIISRAADHIDSFVGRAEIHWGQALSLRSANWPLVPKLPQASQSRGRAELGNARDFLISYGLEHCTRQATALLKEDAEDLEDGNSLNFTLRQHRRLKISIASQDDNQSYSNMIDLVQDHESASLENRVSVAQREIVEQEIFAELIREAGTFPSAAATVSETRITMMAAKDIEANFELIRVDDPDINDPKIEDDSNSPNALICSLLSDVLVLLLIRYHRYQQSRSHPRSQLANKVDAPFSPSRVLRPPSVLAPIVSLLQYYSFCVSLKRLFEALQVGLTEVGVPCNVVFTAVGNDPTELISSLLSYPEMNHTPSDNSSSWIGVEVTGEALVWIDDKHSLRFTFSSPTSLTAHLPHSDFSITDLAVMRDLLRTEVGVRIITSLKDDAERRLGGRWAIESLESECIAEWGSKRVRVRFDDNFKLKCRVYIQTPTEDGGVRARTEEFGVFPSTTGTLKSWFRALCRSLKAA